MDIILVPGLWLDGSSWDRVVPALVAAGHSTHPLTLPGMESRDADRAGIGLRDHVDALVAAIDACGPNEQVILVGHSAGCGIAHGALDARVDRVARAFYIGGFPTGDGRALVDGFTVVDGEVPLPEWSSFDAADLAGLDDDALRVFRERAIASPAHVTTDLQQLSDVRRYDVPVTVICTEFTSAMLRGWIEQGAEPVQELGALSRVDYIDLPTGHWPQFTRPDDLAQLIVAQLRRRQAR
jgi:pimeloyl-ACP methyl ester carboxylesterase